MQQRRPHFWGNADELPLTSFTVDDFLEFNMERNDLNGVQKKAFLRDKDGTAWLLKSGALGDEGSTRPCPDEESSRRAAFPVHEAIVTMLLTSVGIHASDVDLAFRTVLPVDEPRPLRLLVSAHRMVHAQRAD